MGSAVPVVHDVTFEEVKAGLADGSIQLIDVREAYEWDAQHIDGAVLNPLSHFDVSALPPPQEGKRIVLQCRSGKRSITALELAQSAGRGDITAHFGGGMLEWVARGEPVNQK